MCRIDVYDRMPEGMRTYLSNYGWHFSHKLAEWATSPSMMINSEDCNADGKPKQKADRKNHHWTHEQVKDALEKNGIKVENAQGHDCMYVANMMYADYYPKPLSTEVAVLEMTKAYIDDPDGCDGKALTHFYADCLAKGIPIIWEDFI